VTISGCGRFCVAGPSNVTVIAVPGHGPPAHGDLTGAEVRESLEHRVHLTGRRVERHRADVRPS
jgi:hypothetical protein